VPTSNALGEYLRARRGLVSPGDVGLPATGRRRTPGLRREEVATLAGISADYYLRLEQGRDRNPSPQVLEAVARVLQLDHTATRFLLGLAAPRGTAPHRPRRETVPTGVRQLLDVIGLPAYVENRTFDVLAANPLATAISPRIVPGANRLRTILLDPDEQDLLPDWEQLVPAMVAAFRTSLGTDTDDPHTARLVGDLSLASERFRTLWARHDVRPFSGAPVRLHHPDVGPMELRREKLLVPSTAGQILVVHHAEPGTDSARSLALLGSLAATSPARPT